MSPSAGVGLQIDKRPTILKHRQDSIHVHGNHQRTGETLHEPESTVKVLWLL